MGRAQAQYLRIFDNGGTTYQRWQSYYANTSVAWAGANWLYIPFVADGYTAGISGDEANITITAAATSLVVDAFETAVQNGRLAELKTYEFNTEIDNSTPQNGQVLIASYIGQVVGGSGGLTTLTLQLGSALSPVGAQVPPRRFTAALMGRGVSE